MSNSIIYIIDILSIAVILFSVIKSTRDGFAKSLLQTIGSIVALVVSLGLGNILSHQIFDSYLYKYAEKLAGNLVNSISQAEIVSEGIASIPTVLQNALTAMNIDLNAELTKIDFSSMQDGMVAKLVDVIFAPAIIFILAVIIFLVSYWVIKLILRAVGNFLKFINSIPILGGLNKILGAFLGVFKGAVNLFIIAQIIHLVHIILGDISPYISSAVLLETNIFSIVYGINLFSIF